jgi:two-component system CheB/CheR fusion protein
MRLPIDVMFASLARDQGERAIGVVLSGMGSDGSHGLQAIKTQGGLTLAQQPESAQFDSMPRSAIAAGCVDVVAPPCELPGRILGVIRSASPAVAQPASDAGHDRATLGTFLGLLHQRSKRDLMSQACT